MDMMCSIHIIIIFFCSVYIFRSSSTVPFDPARSPCSLLRRHCTQRDITRLDYTGKQYQKSRTGERVECNENIALECVWVNPIAL